MIVKSIINALSRHRLIPTDIDATKSKMNMNYLAGTPDYNMAELYPGVPAMAVMSGMTGAQ